MQTPYEEDIYKAILQFDNNYPVSAPICKLVPPLNYHPNVSNEGVVALKILDEWQPTFTIKKLLLELQNVFDEPKFVKLQKYIHLSEIVQKTKDKVNKNQIESCSFEDLAMYDDQYFSLFEHQFFNVEFLIL